MNTTGESMKLLHIDSSILGENSVSRQVSAAVVARLVAEGVQTGADQRAKAVGEALRAAGELRAA